MYLEKFESFDEKRSSKSSKRPIQINEEEKQSGVNQKKLKSSSKFLKNLLEKDFEYSKDYEPLNIFDY